MQNITYHYITLIFCPHHITKLPLTHIAHTFYLPFDGGVVLVGFDVPIILLNDTIILLISALTSVSKNIP